MLRILSAARHVWAYSPELKTFCDGLIGLERAAVIPWPYDLAATQKLGFSSGRDSGRHKILVQVPMSFHDIVQNHPFVLKGGAAGRLAGTACPRCARRLLFILSCTTRPISRNTSHPNSPKDCRLYWRGKRGYRSFLRFLGECDGVINLTSGSILGRDYFLAAALGRPGIFSNNSPLNARLYPGSGVAMFDTVRLRELVGAMFTGWLVETSTHCFCHRHLRPPRSEIFRRTRLGCAKSSLQSVRW